MRTSPPTRGIALALLTALLAVLFVALAPAPTAGAASAWLRPVEPARIVHGFDPPTHPWESGHRGVDLAAAIGQAVHAPTEGTVTFAGVIAGRGVVVVSHGDVRTTYEPVDADVAVGATVNAGDSLGVLQALAHHCSTPCLHWGAIRGETYIDPASFVEPQPSRLLPVWGEPRLPALRPPVHSLGSEAAGLPPAVDTRLPWSVADQSTPGQSLGQPPWVQGAAADRMPLPADDVAVRPAGEPSLGPDLASRGPPPPKPGADDGDAALATTSDSNGAATAADEHARAIGVAAATLVLLLLLLTPGAWKRRVPLRRPRE